MKLHAIQSEFGVRCICSVSEYKFVRSQHLNDALEQITILIESRYSRMLTSLLTCHHRSSLAFHLSFMPKHSLNALLARN